MNAIICNCVKKPEKKVRTSTGFEPVTSRYRLQRSNQLSYEATDVGSRSIVGSYVPVKVKNASDVYEINHMNCKDQPSFDFISAVHMIIFIYITCSITSL